MQNQSIERFNAAVIRYRLPVIIVCCLLSLFASLGITKLKLRTEFELYFSSDDSQLNNHKKVMSLFGNGDDLILLLGKQNGDLLNPEDLEAIKVITSQAKTIQYVQRVESLSNTEVATISDDDVVLSNLLGKDLKQLDREQLINTIRQQKNINGRLIGKDFNYAFVYLHIRPPDYEFSTVSGIYKQFEALQQSWKKTYPEITVYAVGQIPLKQTMVQAMQHDLTTLLPLTVVVGASLLWLLTRSVLTMLAGSLTVIFPSTIAIGIASAFGFVFNQTSIMCASMIFVISMADTIHITTSYAYGCKKGLDSRLAIKNAMEHNFTSVFYTSLTTFVGFLGVMICDSPPFQLLGGVAALGIVSAWLLVISLLPALLSYIPTSAFKHTPSTDKSLSALARFALRHQKPFRIGFVIVTAITTVFIFNNKLNSNPAEYFGPQYQLRQAVDFIQQKSSASSQLSIVIDTHSQDGALEFALADKALQIEDALRRDKRVVYAASLYDVVRSLAGPNWNNASFNDTFTLLEMAQKSNDAMRVWFTSDRRYALISIGVARLDNQGLIDFESDILAMLKQQGLDATVSGNALMFAHLGLDIARNMISGDLYTLTLVMFFMIFAFRSFIYGIVSMIPNVLPAAFAFGVWGMTSGEIDIAAATTFSISLGIAVDDTIHFVTHYLKYRRQGMSPERAIELIFEQTGISMILTTVILVIGLVILMFSHFSPNQTMGMLTAIILSFALVFELFFMPGLLVQLDGWLSRRASKHQPELMTESANS